VSIFPHLYGSKQLRLWNELFYIVLLFTSSLLIVGCRPQNYDYNDQVMEDEMGRACSTH
jgi:hypothetical protein